LLLPKYQKKVLHFAGVEDVYTHSRGSTRTLGNFVQATFKAISKTYSYLSPDLWPQKVLEPLPFQVHSDWLLANQKQQADKKVGRISS